MSKTTKIRDTTPTTVRNLLSQIRAVADALYKDLADQTGPMDDTVFDTRLHNFILMLQRYEKQNK